ncbi:GNAT family N-acetyltransferase [Methylibium sp.]|uniref:GNAT family N-acetyltransferase n=1 Tax=Methylibium sp. TaxID=2067992 RepID=UPI00286ADB24|nr:GNAT family N-acetyltransferase [Methylibium sp.]
MEPLRISPATPAHFEDLWQLYELLKVEGDPVVSAQDAEQRFAALLTRPDHTIYMAESGGEVVGTYALVFIPGLPHGARDSAIVEDVVVAPEQRGHGIGKSMMRDALSRCRERDCYKLVLSSHLQRDKAHRFYEGLGFSKHGFSFLMT